MSLKVHFLPVHLNFCSENMGDISEEHGKIIHQDISTIDGRYIKWNGTETGWVTIYGR